MQLVTYNPIGKDWVRRYLLRHLELSSIRPKSIDATRVHGTSPERLKQWFLDLKEAIEKYQIKPENIYNMDESSINFNAIENKKQFIELYLKILIFFWATFLLPAILVYYNNSNKISTHSACPNYIDNQYYGKRRKSKCDCQSQPCPINNSRQLTML